MTWKKPGSQPTIPTQQPTMPQRILQKTLPFRPKLQPNDPSLLGWGRNTWILLGWNMAMLFGIFVVIMGVIIFLYQSDLIAPGVKSFGIDIGGKSKSEAGLILQTYWQEQTINLETSHTTSAVSPEALGIYLDLEPMLERAYQQGRSIAGLRELWASEDGVNIPPLWRVNPNMAHNTLQSLTTKFDVAPVNASVSVLNGQAQAIPAIAGRALDVPATVNWLGLHLEEVVLNKRLPLTMRPVSPQITELGTVVEEVNRLLPNTISIYIYDPIADDRFLWQVTSETWVQWLSFEASQLNPNSLIWRLNPEAMTAFINEQSTTFTPETYINTDEAIATIQTAITMQTWDARLRLYYHPKQHTVQSGETFAGIGRIYGMPYPWIQQANPGVSDALYVGQTLTIPSPDVLIPLPIVENKRIIVSISQQKMWAYQDGQLIWEWLASTGIDSSPTSPGIFQVQTHQVEAYASNWDLWMPHFMGIYRPVPTSDFMNGFHGFPTRNGNNLLWTGNLGHQVTYGCILVSSDNAVNLFEWAEQGVIVEVVL